MDFKDEVICFDWRAFGYNKKALYSPDDMLMSIRLPELEILEDKIRLQFTSTKDMITNYLLTALLF